MIGMTLINEIMDYIYSCAKMSLFTLLDTTLRVT